MAGARQRDRGRAGPIRWLAFGALLVVILGLAFGLGVLVGRRARQTQPAVAADFTRKPSSPRRGGLTEASAERSPQLQEKLTFYQTLKAPLGPVRIPDGGDPRSRPAKAPERASEGPPARATDQPPRPTTVGTRAAEERSETRGSWSEPRSGERQEATAEWTVQVGVFSSPRQAAGVKKQLAEGGFEAQVAPTTGSDGQVRYRVRLGGFRSREEAVRTAERVRTDRSLPTYVTTR